MSAYQSIQTGNAPDGFNIQDPNRFLDVATDRFNPDDIRLILWGTTNPDDPTTPPDHHINTLEARELATRLLIAIDTPQHLITELIQLQKDTGTAKETNW